MFQSLFNKLIFKQVKINKCNFCGCNQRAGNPFIVGNNGLICSNCVLSAYKILFGDEKPSSAKEDWDDEYEDIDFLDSIRKKEIEGDHE